MTAWTAKALSVDGSNIATAQMSNTLAQGDKEADMEFSQAFL